MVGTTEARSILGQIKCHWPGVSRYALAVLPTNRRPGGGQNSPVIWPMRIRDNFETPGRAGVPLLWICIERNTTLRMLGDRLPRQFLQQTIEFVLLVSELRPLQVDGHGQSHRTTAIEHGVIAIGDQGS